MMCEERRGRGFLTAILAAAMLISLAPWASASEISGNAEVLESDVLMVDGYRIYLLGVESVEEGQVCSVGDRDWDCWAAAVRALQTITAEGPLVCEPVTKPDVLNQVIARCRLNGEDLGTLFVRSGFGLEVPAETAEYAAVQAEAVSSAVGLWQSRFLSPADWRRANRIIAADRPAFRPISKE